MCYASRACRSRHSYSYLVDGGSTFVWPTCRERACGTSKGISFPCQRSTSLIGPADGNLDDVAHPVDTLRICRQQLPNNHRRLSAKASRSATEQNPTTPLLTRSNTSLRIVKLPAHGILRCVSEGVLWGSISRTTSVTCMKKFCVVFSNAYWLNFSK